MLVIQIPRLYIVIFIIVHPDRSGAQPPEVTCESKCTYTERAKDAECTNRGLNEVPRAVSVCRRSLMFDCSYNFITSLHSTSFLGFWQMKYLRLENNQITSIDPGTFRPVKSSLELLNISSNHLTRIEDGTFVNMTRCKYVLLSDNQIGFISSRAFQGMRRLSKLYLGDNSLTVLDIAIFNGMPNLKEINLRNNRIVQFDLSLINYLPSLQKIFLPNNSISEIVGAVLIVQSSLILLNLSGNHMEDFDCRKLANLTGLNDIYLGSNSLRTVHECRGSTVPGLHLENNQLTCDCGLNWLAAWLRRNPDASSPRCWMPENERGTEVREAVNGCGDDDTLTTTLQNILQEETSPKEHTKSNSKLFSLSQHDKSLTMVENILITTEKVNIPTGIHTASSMDRNIDTNKKNGLFFSIEEPLLYVVLAVVCTVVVAIILLCALKHCCSQYSEKEEKKESRSREISCSDAESAQDAAVIDSHKTSKNHCFPCCTSVADEKEQEWKGETVQPMIEHNYERVVNPHAHSYPRPRQFSSSSESSNTFMIRNIPGGLGGPMMAVPMFNPLMEYNGCTCTCTCNDHISQYSEESYADSDESYQIENRRNEMCDCTGAGVGVHGWMGDVQCQERMRMLPSERPPAYTPSDTTSFNPQCPPPLPPMRYTEPVYIPHNLV